MAPDSTDPALLRDELSRYAGELSTIPGVSRVDAFTGGFSGGQQVASETPISRQRFGNPAHKGTWLSIAPTSNVEPFSAEGEDLVRQIRDAPAPFTVSVGGQSAQLVDIKEAVFGRLP